MKLLRPAMIAIALLVVAAPAKAVEYTIWHSPLLFEPSISAPLLTVEQGLLSASVVVSASAPTDAYIQMPLTIPSNVNVKRVQLCYQVSDGTTYISQVRLTRMTTPNSATIMLDDGTDRNSTVVACETTSSSTLPVDGTYTLLLRLFFADAAHTIKIGAIGIDVDEIVSSAPLP